MFEIFPKTFFLKLSEKTLVAQGSLENYSFKTFLLGYDVCARPE